MDQVSRPMQIALVAVMLLAAVWFAVLRPKADSGTGASAPVAAAPAPGTAGLSRAVDKAHGASATSDAANAATQAASGEATAPSAQAATATPTAAAKSAATAKAAVTKATAKPAKPATKVDRSTHLLASLAKGKTVVLLFSGKGADDRAARRAVQRAAHADHRILAAFAPIAQVGAYDAITSGVEILTAPTILVIGKDRKAVELTGYVDQRNVRQAVGDVRRAAATAKN